MLIAHMTVENEFDVGKSLSKESFDEAVMGVRVLSMGLCIVNGWKWFSKGLILAPNDICIYQGLFRNINKCIVFD